MKFILVVLFLIALILQVVAVTEGYTKEIRKGQYVTTIIKDGKVVCSVAHVKCLSVEYGDSSKVGKKPGNDAKPLPNPST